MDSFLERNEFEVIHEFWSTDEWPEQPYEEKDNRVGLWLFERQKNKSNACTVWSTVKIDDLKVLHTHTHTHMQMSCKSCSLPPKPDPHFEWDNEFGFLLECIENDRHNR